MSEDATPEVKPAPPLQRQASSSKILKSRVEKSVFKSVVKIFCKKTEYWYAQPWNMQFQKDASSSGFVIKNRKIVCNAHGVAFHTRVEVRKHLDTIKYTAFVEHITHDGDLAILVVENEEFWKDLEPLSFGSIPEIEDEVVVVGYPKGGSNLCVTKGVVSRVDMKSNAHSGCFLLRIQIDAAINSGSSGGPCLLNGKVVGVAFESMTNADNIGYIIPVPIIQQFLQHCYGDKKHFKMGFGWTGLQVQTLENPAQRRFLKMSDKLHGQLVTKISPLSDSYKKIEPRDVLLSIDGNDIADDGTVLFRNFERINWRFVSTLKYPKEIIPMQVLRNGEIIDLEVAMHTCGAESRLVRPHMYDRIPSYFVFGGFVFTVLSNSFLRSYYGSKWHSKARKNLLERSLYGRKTSQEEEIVIVTQVLGHDVNKGFDFIANEIVETANGEDMTCLRQMVELVDGLGDDDFLSIRTSKYLIDMHVGEGRKANKEILGTHAIPVDRSSDLIPKEEDEKKEEDVDSAIEIGDDAAKVVELNSKEEDVQPSETSASNSAAEDAKLSEILPASNSTEEKVQSPAS